MQLRLRRLLLIGDLLTLALVTLAGFATHGTLGSAGTRLLATFLPFSLAWLLVAPFGGAYDLERLGDWRQLWRPVWAAVVAAPGATWLRGLWLNAPILPLFVLIMAGVSALAMFLWRLLFFFLIRKHLSHG